jgi:hypothetical protein
MALLAAGDQLPHVELTGVDGAAVPYRRLWQRRALLLVMAPAAAAAGYAAQLAAAEPELDAHAATSLVTTATVPGLPFPGVAVADRWGELVLVSGELLPPASLLEWVRYTQMQCPECQGEAR